MGGDYERGVIAIGGVDKRRHRFARGQLIELARGFVDEDQLGVLRDRARNGDALRLSAGQLFRKLVGDLGEAEVRERRFCLLVRRCFVKALQEQRNHHVLDSVQPGRKTGRLEDDGDGAWPPVARLIDRRPGHAAGGRVEQSGHHMQERRLAAPRGTNERDARARADLETCVHMAWNIKRIFALVAASSIAVTPAPARSKRRDAPVTRSRTASGLVIDDPSVRDPVDAVRRGGKRHAVRGEQGGASRMLARDDEPDQLALGVGVDFRSRFVGDEDGRVGGQRNGEAGPSGLAAREL